MIPMILFALIAALGFFHVISAETTACGFLAWLAVMVIRSMVLRAGDESREEPERIPPVGLGGCLEMPRKYEEGYASSPPQGGDATIPVTSRYGHKFTIGSGLGSDVPASSPPQGGDATIPVDPAEINIKQWALRAREVTGGRQRNTALLALMKTIERELNARLAVDEEAMQLSAYDEPTACYPLEMKIYDR